MKKTILLSFFCTVFLITSNYAQHLEFGVTVQTNYVKMGIENSFPVFDAVDSLFYQPRGAYKTQKEKLNYELGVEVKYEVFDGFKLISGIGVRYLQLERPSEEAQPSILNGIGSYWAGQSYGQIFGGAYATTGVGGPPDSVILVNNPTEITEGNYWVVPSYKTPSHTQKLLYLTVPINLGYTTPSDRWTFFGGLWYSRLLNANYENHGFYGFESNDIYRKNLFGYNAGLDVKIVRNFSIVFNYSGVASNVFATKSPFDYMIGRRMVASKNVHIFSLGMSYSFFSK